MNFLFFCTSVSYSKEKTGGIMHVLCLNLGLLLSLLSPSLSCMELRYPVHQAAERNDDQRIHHLVKERGWWVNEQDDRGNTPLHSAAQFGRVNALRHLLALGALIETKNRRGSTALHEATDKGHLECVNLLLTYGAIPNRKAKNKKRPLHLAAFFGRNTIIRLLLNSGAYPNARDAKGRTPMHIAAVHNFPDTVRLLASRGGNPYISTHKGSRVIDNPAYSICEFFKSLTNLQTHLYQAVEPCQLWRAVRCSQRRPVEVLLVHAAQPLATHHIQTGELIMHENPIYVCDPSGNTLLHMAATGYSPALVQLLINIGLDPRKRNNVGQTAIDFAQTHIPHALTHRTAIIYLQLCEAARFYQTLTDRAPNSETSQPIPGPSKEQEENCCICKEPLTSDTRIYLAPCGHNNLCRVCARKNFLSNQPEEHAYRYRQVCPLCRKPVDLYDLEERLQKNVSR